jgi:hypothetical protein
MCLRPRGGALELGVDYSKDKRFVWTPISQQQWYSVDISDIKIGNKSIGFSSWYLDSFGTIVDSGTTLLIFPTEVFTAVKKMFLAICSTVRVVFLVSASISFYL